ncbi:MAG TPA: PfkB family carbohydrate kinase [Gemmataceae bacterium]|nr:PfkB family carbohydrate kinase [Gemmataceae bacterium]
MLTTARLESILTFIPRLTIGVVGDLFLDRYLDLDASLTEASLETGLDAYQVVGVRSQPGAAGTVLKNLASLGVKSAPMVALISDDGEGYELRQALAQLRVVDAAHLVSWPGRRTPTYTKPMLREPGQPARELNRLDFKNRRPTPRDPEERVIAALDEVWPRVDALLVVDQVSEPDCGVVTQRVRERLTKLGRSRPDKPLLTDSRERIGLFDSTWLKPNQTECVKAVKGVADGPEQVEHCAIELARRNRRPVFCTRGRAGILVVDSRGPCERVLHVPAYPVQGPVDIVGAGDSTSAAIACALAAGAKLEEAAAFGNLVASITIQQIGTTGTASPDQLRERWRQVQVR